MPLPDLQADIAACRSLIRSGSRTFFAASFLLPRRIREPAYALYAFCRVADDAIDHGLCPTEALQDLHHRLDRAYAGRPLESPIDRAFSETVLRFAIPPALPAALLEGFAWDAEERRYADLDGVLAYAARVAGSVGAMMAILMGRRDAESIARATDLGMAMQLTNIARDVGDDARAGRLYLPLDRLAAAGVDAERFLAAPCLSPALADVVAEVLDLADGLYARAESGIAGLPVACRPAILAARLLYAEIGHRVRRRGFDPVSSRAVVSSRDKAAILLLALAGSVGLRIGSGSPPDDAARFLVDAAASMGGDGREPVVPLRGRIGDRIAWVIDLFEQLERRDRLAR